MLCCGDYWQFCILSLELSDSFAVIGGFRSSGALALGSESDFCSWTSRQFFFLVWGLQHVGPLGESLSRCFSAQDKRRIFRVNTMNFAGEQLLYVGERVREKKYLSAATFRGLLLKVFFFFLGGGGRVAIRGRRISMDVGVEILEHWQALGFKLWGIRYHCPDRCNCYCCCYRCCRHYCYDHNDYYCYCPRCHDDYRGDSRNHYNYYNDYDCNSLLPLLLVLSLWRRYNCSYCNYGYTMLLLFVCLLLCYQRRRETRSPGSGLSRRKSSNLGNDLDGEVGRVEATGGGDHVPLQLLKVLVCLRTATGWVMIAIRGS